MHRCDTLLSSTKNAPDSLYRPGQPAVHPNRSQRSIFGGRPYPQCLRFSPQVVSSTCGIDMCPPFQVKRHEAKPRLSTCHQVLYCLRLLLIHPSPRNLSAGQQANLQWSAPHCPAHVRQRRGTAPAQEYCSVSTPPLMRSQYASAFRRLSPTRLQAPGATAMRSPASRYLQKRQVIGGATPVFQIQRWGRQTSSGQWPGSCVGSTHNQLKLMRRSVRMRKTGLPGAGGDAPLVTRRWRLLCVAHCSAGPR